MIPPSGDQHELVFENQRAVVVEVGGGIRSYDGVVDGYALDETCTAGRGQVLAPWPNRISGGTYAFDGHTYQLALTDLKTRSAIHGLVRCASWSLLERENARAVLEHVLRPQQGYPFMLRLRVEYRLGVAGLSVRTTAENIGRAGCPFGVGHHPYIAGRPTVDDLVLGVPGRDPFPIGQTQLDTAFTDLVPDADGLWRVHAGDVTVWADASWPYVQIFTGDLPDVQRRGLAVEPMTCPPNAFNTGEGVIRLEPGDVFDGSWGITP